MPKPVKELERKQRPRHEQVIEFLEQDPHNGYTTEEIAAGVRAGDARAADLIKLSLLLTSLEKRKQMLAPWQSALDMLVQLGQVLDFKDGGTVYYAHKGR